MSQLLIIDVQNTYKSHCSHLFDKIPEFAKDFASVVYLFDNINGEDYHEQLPEEWLYDGEEENPFCDRLKVMTKQYAFFRSLMDVGVDESDDELVKLAQFMIEHKITDSRQIKENEEVYPKYQEKFKHSPLNNLDFEDYGFFLPEDLIEDLRNGVQDGVILVGGGRNECLKEVALLLRVLEIKFSIHEELTY